MLLSLPFPRCCEELILFRCFYLLRLSRDRLLSPQQERHANYDFYRRLPGQSLLSHLGNSDDGLRADFVARHTTDLALRRDLSPNFNTAPNLTEVCSKNKLVVESRAIDLRSCLSRAVSCCGHGIRSQSSRTEKKLHIISEQVDLLTPVLLLG